MASVGVVGAGAAGLAAAYRLMRLGVDVTVYEASAQTGGVVRTQRQRGWLAEWGPNALTNLPPEVEKLLTEVGLAKRWIYARRSARHRYVVRGRRLVRLPRSPLGLATTRLLSFRAKLRLLGEPFVRRAAADESVATFVRRRFGAEAVDLAAALVSGVYAGDPEQLSMRYAFPRLAALEQKRGSVLRGLAGARASDRGSGVRRGRARLRSLPEGLQEIPDALAGALGTRVRLRVPVRAIARTPDGWSVATDTGEVAHDAVVAATPAHAFDRMHVECPGGTRLRELAAIAHAPVAVLALGFRREDVGHPLDGFGALVTPKADRDLLGVIFSSTVFPGRAPSEHVLVTALAGGAQRPWLAALEAEPLERLLMPELRALLGITAPPGFVHHVRWPQAIPQYTRDHGRLLAMMDDVERASPGFHLAGSYRHGVSLGDALRSGLGAAERVAADVAASLRTP